MILALLAVSLIILVGIAVASRFLSRLILPADIGLCFAFGLGTVTLLMEALSLFYLHLSVIKLLIASTIIIVATLNRPKITFRKPSLDFWSIIWGAAIGITIGLVFIKTFGLPIWGYDAYASWLARGRAIFVDKIITPENINAFYPPDHPLLWSLITTYVYTFIGSDSELWLKIVPFTVYWLIIITLGHECRKLWPKSWGLLVLPFMVTPMMLEQVSGGLSGNADLLVAFFVLVAGIKLNQKKYYLAAFLFGLAAMTKNDALPLAIASIIICLKHKPNLKSLILMLTPLASLVLFRLIFYLPSRYLGLPERSYLAAAKYTLHAFREEFRFYSRWHLVWWQILALFGTTIGHIKNFLLTYALLSFQLVSLVIIFVFTPEPTTEGHVASALFRLLLQLFPLIYLTVLAQVKTALVLKSK